MIDFFRSDCKMIAYILDKKKVYSALELFRYQYVIIYWKNTYDFIYETLFLCHLNLISGSHLTEKTCILICVLKIFLNLS